MNTYCQRYFPVILNRLYATLLIALGQAILAVNIKAQIVVDGNAPSSQQPTLLEAGNGVPLVNIQTPSAAGVSRNTYQQFDINASGAILNNANTNVQTQLGGWIQGNPWLSQGTARIILNEVNASDPSQLRGMVEIAGQRAELVIANPAGITCNGCGFINTQRATLTTGTPIIYNGNLESYRVHGGNISVTSAGMDARNSDYTAIIAHSVVVNADLWAQQLYITTGAQEINVNDHSTIRQITGNTNTAEFALDVSALGGMYAQKIVLRGTEYGVGVRNAGIIGAQAGELIVTSAGRLENSGELHAQTNAQLTANEIINSGIISANQNLNAHASQTIDNRSGQLFSANTLDLQAKNVNNQNGLIYAGNNIIANISDTLDNQHRLIFTDEEINLKAYNILNRNTQNRQKGIQGEKVQLSTGYIDNAYGTIAADQEINIYDARLLDNSYGQISSAEDITISAQEIQNTHGILLADQALNITADYLTGDGKLLSKGNISLTLQEDFINTGEITANGRAELKIAAVLDNYGLLQAGDLHAHGKQINNAEAGIIHGNRNTIIADDRLENRGIIDGGVAYVKATKLDNVGTGRIYGDQLAISADNLYNFEENNQAAVIAARERLDIGVNNLFNQEHALIFSAGSSDNALNIGGSLDANQHVTGQAKLIRNDSATIESLGGLTINSQQLFNTNLYFVTELVQVAGPKRYLYIQPNGDPNKHNVDEYDWNGGWSNGIGGYWDKKTEQKIHNWTQFDVLQTEYETQVISSDPALIRSGGDITLLGGTLTNDKSHIIAGGVLKGDLNRLDNIDGFGEHIINQVGTSQYTYRKYRGSPRFRYQRKWDGRTNYTPADEVQTISLDVVKKEQQSRSGGSGFNVENRKTITQIDNTYTVEINLVIPNNKLFNTNPNANYWIETDPRFTDYKQWLSSDYMLNQLGMDPNAVHKRLGDGFYEQQLIRDQIGQLTGRRFLDGYANDENQYRALLEAGATFAKSWNLQPGIALSAEQMAQLTSDIVWLVQRDIILADGTTTQALVPQVYVRLQADDLNGRGTLLAADRIDLNLNADLVNSGTIAGRTALRLNSDNLHNLGGRISGKSIDISTHNDIDNIGGVIHADNALLLNAGRDLNVRSTTHSDSKTSGLSDFSRTNVDRIASIYVNQGDLYASAARDINLTGASIINQDGSTTMLAGGDLNLDTIQIAEHENNVSNVANYLKQSSTQDVGTSIQTNGDIYLHAKQNLTTTAANVRSEHGTIQASAEGDISIQAGQSSIHVDEAHRHKDRGLLGSKQTTTRDSFQESRAIGSTFSGENVIIQGNNITVTGSNIVSDNHTVLNAENNLTIQSSTETHTEKHSKEVVRKGMLYNGGMALTIGKQSQNLDKQDTNTYASASTIGSIQANVLLTAGDNYQQIGSHVVAAEGDIDIHAQNVEIVEARETGRNVQEYQFRQSGLTVALSAPVISAIQTGQQMVSAMNKTDDTRVQALAAVTTGFAAKDAYRAMQANPETAGGLNISISYGKSENSSKSTMENNTAAGSTIVAGGDLRISATGSTDSMITVRGSEVNSDRNITLKTDGEINLLAAENTVETTRRSRSSSIGAGVGFSVGQVGGPALGVTTNASSGKGEGDGSDIIWSNTHINAGKRLNLESGANTNLRGAVASGKQVIANVGGDLNIESLQDTSTYHSKDTSISGSVTTGSGSVNYSRQTINLDYASVIEQTGIQAGDGGFQINVKGNTDLKGSVIASSDKAIADGSNRLETGTLSVQDIDNYANANVKSNGFGLSSDWMKQGKYGVAKTLIQNTQVTGNANENSIGHTKSAVSAGVVIIRDQQAQQSKTGISAADTITSLHRDARNTHVATERADTNKLEEQAQIEKTVETAFMNGMLKRSDDAYKTMFLKEHDVYKVERDEEDKLVHHKLTDEEKKELQSSGKMIRLSVNGIFNDTDKAAKFAEQHNSDLESDSYMIAFPKADTGIGELLIAGYQKFFESNSLGLTNSTKEVKNFMRTNGQTGLVFDAHSRGAMTVGNAMKSLIKEGDNDGILSGTNINFYGPAYNAQKTANMLHKLSSGAKNHVQLQNHAKDIVGRFIGWNPETHNTSNKSFERMRMLLPNGATAHNCYGNGGKDGECGDRFDQTETKIIKAQKNERK